MKKTIVSIFLVGMLSTVGWWYWHINMNQAVAFRTVAVKRGDLLAQISATGTVEPEEVVDIGAQVAGQIQSFGRDPNDSSKMVDYGTPVEVGTVLAQIDASLYASDVEQAKAALEQAKANEQRAVADLGQMKAKLYQADRDWARVKKLGPNSVMAQSDFDAYQAAYETAKSTLAVGEASVVQAQKAAIQADAALKKAQVNLGYCTIKAPVKGVIVDRRVNTGQTVVASLSAPSLFLIAKDLKRLQVWASVNEADIGQIHPGQAVRFTVDAYPGTTFKGVVNKIRLNATMTQNVVTYTVEVNTDNKDGKLLPYLTANLQFEVSHKTNVLLVPNSALRWKPQYQQVAPDVRADFAKAGKPTGGQGSAGAEKPKHDQGIVWVEDGDFVRPITVKMGLSDGTNTEVQSDKLSDDTEVVVGEVHHSAGGDTTNPFAPQMFGGRKQQ